MTLPSVLIGTPAYAGNLHVSYLNSILSIADLGIDYDVLVTANESLINRARNNIASQFLRTDYDVLAFLDADIEIKGEDFASLLAMPGIRGAIVPLKDRTPRSNAWKDGKMVLPGPSLPQTVDYLGTAVMMMDTTVLASLALSTPKYDDPIVGECWEFFPTYVSRGTLLSEDYGFCELAWRVGHEIWVDPSIAVKHYGVQAF